MRKEFFLQLFREDRCVLCFMMGKASELEVQGEGSCLPAVRIAHLVSAALKHLCYCVRTSSLSNPPICVVKKPWAPNWMLGIVLSLIWCELDIVKFSITVQKPFCEFCSKVSWVLLKILNFFLSMVFKADTGASTEKVLELHDLRQSALTKNNS